MESRAWRSRAREPREFRAGTLHERSERHALPFVRRRACTLRPRFSRVLVRRGVWWWRWLDDLHGKRLALARQVERRARPRERDLERRPEARGHREQRLRAR